MRKISSVAAEDTDEEEPAYEEWTQLRCSVADEHDPILRDLHSLKEAEREIQEIFSQPVNKSPFDVFQRCENPIIRDNMFRQLNGAPLFREYEPPLLPFEAAKQALVKMTATPAAGYSSPSTALTTETDEQIDSQR